MWLLVVSGINAEGTNVVLATVILCDISQKTLTWALWEYRQTIVRDQETIISEYKDDALSTAIAAVFEMSNHLFCQNSVKKHLRDNLQDIKKRTIYHLIFDLIQEPSPDVFLQ